VTHTRRDIMAGTAAAGAVTVLPYAARGDADAFQTPAGEVVVHPISHASFVLETPVGLFFVDPVGGPEPYAAFQAPDVILITHRHGDHFDPATLAALKDTDAPILTCADVHGLMNETLQARTTIVGHDDSVTVRGTEIAAIPAYNLDPDSKFHPKSRGDNGFIVNLMGFRVYISGDTEDIPEMRALGDIDLAFVCMNLPFTMTSDAAASAVAAFRPRFVYPYHYRGRDGGTQDPKAFAAAVGDAAEVRLADWYPDNPDL